MVINRIRTVIKPGMSIPKPAAGEYFALKATGCGGTTVENARVGPRQVVDFTNQHSIKGIF